MNNNLKPLIDFWKSLKIEHIEDNNVSVPAGAATFSLCTHLSVSKKLNLMYLYPCFRPYDIYGNPALRKSGFMQFQVMINNYEDFYAIYNLTPIELAYKSIATIIGEHAFSALEDNWSAPTMKSYGIGWEYRANGLEVLQITKFNKFMGEDVSNQNIYEFAYGVDRIMSLAKLEYNNNISEKYARCIALFNYYSSQDVEILNNMLINICQKEILSYDNFLSVNLIFNILDVKSYFNIYTKNLYMHYISQTIKKINNKINE